MKKDFLRLLDLSDKELVRLLDLADVWKKRGVSRRMPAPLKGRTLAMVFQKASTRTRVSFEVAMTRLGGHAIFLSPNDSQIGRGEPVKDTARVLARFADAIMVRTFAHAVIDEMAAHAVVPIINGLTDDHHPCQIVADLQTARERGKNIRSMTVAFIGDGNNVANSWVEAAHLLGFTLKVACPKGFEPNPAVMGDAEAVGRGEVRIVRDPAEAAKGADVLYTDVWTSMGQETEQKRRLKAFKGFCIDSALLGAAKKDAIVMHCLPAHRGEEITDDVIEGPQSAIFDEAENRLHAQAAILDTLIPH